MKNITYFFIIAAGIIVCLILGRSLLIPFLFALLLWFLIKKIRLIFDKIPFIKKHFPIWLKNVIPSILMLLILGFISSVLSANINYLAESHEHYKPNIAILINNINEFFNINIIDALKAYSVDLDFSVILKAIFKSLTDLLSNTFIIVIYVIFILLEETYFPLKIEKALTSNSQYVTTIDIFKDIEKSISNYITVKTLTSLSTGVLSYACLFFIGIDSPVFWAFLIFLLNYIPNIGSMIATLFPALFCLLQFGGFAEGNSSCSDCGFNSGIDRQHY